MGTGSLLVVALVMAVGVVGVLVPVLPGLLLIAVAALVWALTEQDTLAWVVFAAMMVVLGLGAVAKYVLPARDLAAAGAPRSTMLVGALGAVIGFFAIPVVGLLVGGVAGVFVAELRRLNGDRNAAWRSTWVTIKAVGLGILIELVAALAAVAIWVVAVLVG
ncbi:MAG: DUF456 domain-containing protein [Geodermatophilaceae bacterium]|nr:DUF456 domain-containing protein [Geodermatophilaceae bacterium]